jgi:ferredoxin-NADP reductase
MTAGFRRLRVTARVRESETITSFHLEPVEPEGWRPFEAGQFLAFRIPVADGFALKTYSVSSSPADTGHYRITVKREATPGLPDGVGSCHLHDRVGVGDELLAEGPRGEFYLDRDSPRPVVLLSGGVGLTPLVSMLHSLTDRPVYFIHACDHGGVHALDGEVRALAARRPGVAVHICYRHPRPQDSGRCDSQGLVTRDRLRGLLPLDDYDVYLCGPPPFIQAMYATLRSLGVPKHRIAYEFFGPATVLDPDGTAEAPPVPAPPEATGAVTVEFRRTGRTVAWDERCPSLLDFAEAQGLDPDFSCRAGICNTCESGLIDGEVEYFEPPLDQPPPGRVLLCCSRPRRSVVLDL